MRVQFLSDTHIELSKRLPVLEKHGDVLVLAGDIGNPFHPLYTEFLKDASNMYGRVYVIAGNHEYYGYTIEEVDAKIGSLCKEVGDNVVFLQCSEDVYGDVRFLGCTLWSQVEDRLLYKLNDFAYILKEGTTRIRPEDVRRLHEEQKKWLEDKLDDGCVLPTIVVTHHAPMDEMNGVYCGGMLASGFATDLPHMFKAPVVGWITGHTHQNLMIHVQGIPCVANCMGYVGEHTGYRNDATLNIVGVVQRN